uniref:Uncharacterized protein n=1 Tax=Anguilla anguilla TaxID=7936 RepID=A0A0E9V8W7_ANGAN
MPLCVTSINFCYHIILSILHLPLNMHLGNLESYTELCDNNRNKF